MRIYFENYFLYNLRITFYLEVINSNGERFLIVYFLITHLTDDREKKKAYVD